MDTTNCILCRNQLKQNYYKKSISQCNLDYSQKTVKAVLVHLFKCAKIEFTSLSDNELVCNECFFKLNEYDKIMLLLTDAQKELINMVKSAFTESKEETVNNDLIIETVKGELELSNSDNLEFLTDIEPNTQGTGSDSESSYDQQEDLATLKNKMKRHKTQLFLCKICGVERKDEEYLELHMNTHEGKTEYECRYCPKKFARRTNVIRHMNIHWNKLKYQCEKCGERFSQSSILYNHRLAHEGEENPIVCETCNQSFKTVKTYKHHMISHQKDRPRYGCEICGKSFTEKYTLKIHLKTHFAQ